MYPTSTVKTDTHKIESFITFRFYSGNSKRKQEKKK